MNDDRLARRAAAGDERAFAAIFRRYHQALYRYCLAIVGNPPDAQDALQSTMVKALRALPGEERQIELKPWLYRIAHNEAVEMLRRQRPAEELDPEQAGPAVSVAEGAEQRERLRRLLADLGQLPERQRAALVMRELSGLGYGEIAAALGASQAVARQTLYEARLSLRQMAEGREMGCDAVTRALSDADGRVTGRRDIRAHLRTCSECRRFGEEIAARRGELAALAPLPAVAAAGLLQGLFGGAAVKTLGTATAVKSAAAVVAVAVVGVGAADRGGVVDATPWGGGDGAVQRGQGGQSPLPRSQPSSLPRPAGVGAAGAVSAVAVQRGLARRDARSRGEDPAGGNGHGGDPGAETPVAAVPGPPAAHPYGRGHEKQHPAAASHGQETAASHKAAGKGASAPGAPGRSSQPHGQAQQAQAGKPSPKSAQSAPAGAKAGGAKQAPAAAAGPAAAPPAPGSPEPRAPQVPPAKEAPDKSSIPAFQP